MNTDITVQCFNEEGEWPAERAPKFNPEDTPTLHLTPTETIRYLKENRIFRESWIFIVPNENVLTKQVLVDAADEAVRNLLRSLPLYGLRTIP